MSGVNVKSEIKPLKKVLLHRPGKELLNLTPNTLEELLFDDIPFLKVAQEEHDAFAQAPVSYTHLDVYKRQAPRRFAASAGRRSSATLCRAGPSAKTTRVAKSDLLRQ